MTEKELLKLYGLRGTVTGLRTCAKCGYRAAYECMQGDCSKWATGYFQGMMRVHIERIHDCQSLYREISKIIKEAKNGKVPTQVV